MPKPTVKAMNVVLCPWVSVCSVITQRTLKPGEEHAGEGRTQRQPKATGIPRFFDVFIVVVVSRPCGCKSDDSHGGSGRVVPADRRTGSAPQRRPPPTTKGSRLKARAARYRQDNDVEQSRTSRISCLVKCHCTTLSLPVPVQHCEGASAKGPPGWDGQVPGRVARVRALEAL